MSARRHRWMALVPYELTDQDALRMTGLQPYAGSDLPKQQIAGDEVPAPDDARPFLGLHNICEDLVTICCYDCEVALTDARLIDLECAGQPAGEIAYVDANGQRTAEDTARPFARRDVGGLGTGLGAVGRNDPCPCGSGRKFKRCHGA